MEVINYMETKFVYPVILNYEKDSSGYDYFVTIPDFDGYTQGKNIADAIDMARDYIGNILMEYEKEGKEFPGSFTVELKYFRSMPWYKAIFLSNFFDFILVLFRTLWYNRVG